MKRIHYLHLFSILAVVLSGCISSGSTTEPISIETQSSSPTSVPPTSTLTPTPAQAPTLTPPATLEPEQAKDVIGTLLQEPVDCLAPCFWGIFPEKTTIGEAKNIFTRLGLELEHTNTQNNEDFYALIYDSDSGLRVSPILMVQNDIVKNINVGINPEKHQIGIPREWLAYSPETLINRYGPPSRVDFSVDRGPHDPGTPYIDYFMIMYFDKVNMIISYEYGSIDSRLGSLRVCPLIDQFTLVRIWLGPNPENPPLKETPLEEATSITMEQFSELLTGNPNKACFNLKEEVFP